MGVTSTTWAGGRTSNVRSYSRTPFVEAPSRSIIFSVVLSDRQLGDFARNGYIVVCGAVDEAVSTELDSEVDALINQKPVLLTLTLGQAAVSTT